MQPKHSMRAVVVSTMVLNFDNVAATLHPDVTLYETPSFMGRGTYHGHAGWQDLISQMIKAFT